MLAPPTEPATHPSLSTFLDYLKLYLKVRRVFINHLIQPTFPLNTGVSSIFCLLALNHFQISPVSSLSTPTWNSHNLLTYHFHATSTWSLDQPIIKINPFHPWRFFKYLKSSVPALHPPEAKLVFPVISYKRFLIFLPHWTQHFEFAPELTEIFQVQFNGGIQD